MKPLALFLRSHFQSRHLSEVRWQRELGRVLTLSFGDGELEVRLFPHGENAIATANGKKLSWNPVKKLGESINVGRDSKKDSKELRASLSIRSQTELFNERFRSSQSKSKVNSSVGSSAEDSLKIAIDKRVRALQKVEKSIDDKDPDLFQKAAEFLQMNLHEEFSSGDIPEEFTDIIDTKEDFRSQMQELFDRAKRERVKQERAKVRLKELSIEILALESGKMKPPSESKRKLVEDLVRSVPGKREFQKFTTPSGLIVLVGKSATANLALLRKSKPWNVWMHMKNEPGAHAVFQNDKNQDVSEIDLKYMGEQLAIQKKHYSSGDLVELIVSECRYVRPLKGDRHGRVTVQHPRTVSLRLK